MKTKYAIVTLMLLIAQIGLCFDFKQSTLQMLADLNAGDSVKFCQHFHSNTGIHNVTDKGLETLIIEEFSPVLAKFKTKQFQEEFTDVDVTELETGLTYVDVRFSFFINNELAFSGIDHVLWISNDGGVTFKIGAYYSGALKPKFTTSNGTTTAAGQLDALIDKWHRDVAEFKYDDYFGFMDERFIFLGTDPSERWTKAQFAEFCKPHFEKKSTWDFKPLWRNWYFSEDGKTAWFEEQLNTWMQECRASGVLMKINDEWKIVHYNLTVLIENEKTVKFIKLRKK